MKITLVGVGMGNPASMTREADAALREAGVIIGSERLLAALPADYPGQRSALALPHEVAAVIEAHPEWESAVVALSGDVGFHSGARRLLELLRDHEPGVVCGISTPQYFAARLRRPWQDFRLVSAHCGKCDILAEVLNHREVFFLTGGGATAADIVETLCAAGLDDAKVTVGENLSSPDERIRSATAGRLRGEVFAPLCAVLVENARSFTRAATSAGIEDEAFERGSAPMTKREVRAVALSLLKPRLDGVYCDVGAGTGSVAVELALAARRGGVYAVERDSDACGLIEANKRRFGTYNLRVERGVAPEALASLPTPDAAFIGGNGGGMRAILECLTRKNPKVRLVASAATLETLHAATEGMKALNVANVSVVQIAASRVVARGGVNMLSALNPVFLVSGGGADGE